MTTSTRTLHQYLSDVHSALQRVPIDAVQRVVQILLEAQQQGRWIFTAGNGGSAATASHFACDMAKVVPGDDALGQRPIRAISLVDCTPRMTALANDLSYRQVFAEQLRCLAGPGDVLICISYAGESENLLEAVERARDMGVVTIGFVGSADGRLGRVVDCSVTVHCNAPTVAEDIHLMLEHMICTRLRELLSCRSAVEQGPGA